MKKQQKIYDRDMQVDYRYRTTMPIRDMHLNGEIVFLVDVYGWSGMDVVCVIGNANPMIKAVRRIGLDPDRYQAMIWDAEVGGKKYFRSES